MVTNARGRSKGGAPQRRRVALPKITYPENLPVSARRSDIATAIENHQVVIIAGETGSGKTTQIPKICLELGRDRKSTRLNSSHVAISYAVFCLTQKIKIL